MSLVKFSDPDEFIAELERDRAWIEDDIVRVTLHKTPMGTPHVYRFEMMASAIVRTPSDRRTVIQCMTVQGLYTTGQKEEKQIHDAGEQLYKRIHDELAKMKCDIRAGVYQETPRIG